MGELHGPSGWRGASSRRLRTLGSGVGLGLALVASLAWGHPVTATNVEDFTPIAATGGESIDPDSAGLAWTNLSGPFIDVAVYSNPDTFASGLSFTLTLPLGFEWNPAVTVAPTIAIAPGMPAGFCTVSASELRYATAASGAWQATFTLSGAHDVGCRITLAGLQVRPVAGVRAGAGGQITVAWKVPGVGVGRASGGLVRLAAGENAGSLPPTDVSSVPSGPDRSAATGVRRGFETPAVLFAVAAFALAFGRLRGRRAGR